MQAILMSSIFPYIFLIAILGACQKTRTVDGNWCKLATWHRDAPASYGFNAGWAVPSYDGAILERTIWLMSRPCQWIYYSRKNSISWSADSRRVINRPSASFLGMEWWVTLLALELSGGSGQPSCGPAGPTARIIWSLSPNGLMSLNSIASSSTPSGA